MLTRQVGHLKRGIYGWDMEKLPFVGTYDSMGAGRTPSVVEEEIFSYGRAVRVPLFSLFSLASIVRTGSNMLSTRACVLKHVIVCTTTCLLV